MCIFSSASFGQAFAKFLSFFHLREQLIYLKCLSCADTVHNLIKWKFIVRLPCLTSVGICRNGRGWNKNQNKRSALFETRTYHSELLSTLEIPLNFVQHSYIINLGMLTKKVYFVNNANCLFLQKPIRWTLHEFCLAIHMAFRSWNVYSRFVTWGLPCFEDGIWIQQCLWEVIQEA